MDIKALASEKISSGTFMSFNMGVIRPNITNVIARVYIADMIIDAAADCRTPFSSPAPNFCAVITVKPAVNPMVIAIMKKNSGPVEPTAAKEFTPNKRPTMMVSEILYSC